MPPFFPLTNYRDSAPFFSERNLVFSHFQAVKNNMISAQFCSTSASTLALLFSTLVLSLSLWPGQQKAAEAIPIPINHLRAFYPPISDAYLRTLLGYAENEEMPPPKGGRLMMFSQQPVVVGGGEEPIQSHQQEQLLVTKRKNAELVNHILKNFASINRLGDAGK